MTTEQGLLEQLRATYSYDPSTGLFTFIVNRQGRRRGDRAGVLNPNTGYVTLKVGGKRRQAHRMAWLYVNGEMPQQYIDHINGDRTDNRIANLRDVTLAVNAQNRRTASPSKTSCAFLGVTLHKKTGKWQASIALGGRDHYLGLHATPELAHSAYAAAKRELHPESSQ
jgi:hypothetical protein